ncbi:MAG: hypothetical protein AAB443_02805 [Patescibacteria group bacterium]
MVTFILVLLVLYCAFVILRHQGDWKEANEEIVEVSQNVFATYIIPALEMLWELAGRHKRTSVIGLVIVSTILCATLGIVTLRIFSHDVVSLKSGQNVVEDNCGNEVPVWVLPAHTDLSNQRIEITPAEIGKTVVIQAPGSETRCAFPLQVNLK